MKLRNKKTGKFGYMLTSKDIDEYMIIDDDYFKIISYDSLAKVNEEWEDYKPSEPLIKDEKIRKAVRAWAKANSQQTSIAYKQLEEAISCLCFIDFGGLVIEFNKPIDGLTSEKIYKFNELCGEEE